MGVDVFFVISGYVITLNLVSEYLKRSIDVSDIGIISIRSFYARRIKRIIPVSFFVLCCNLIAGFFLFNSSRFKELLVEAINNVFFVGNLYQIRIETDYLNSTMAQTPLRHYWSLSIEEQFYLFYPVLFLVVLSLHGLKFRKRNIPWNNRLVIFILMLTLASFFYSILDVWARPTSAYFSTLGRIWEIGFGCLVCMIDTIMKQRQTLVFDKFAPYVGLGLILLSAVIYDDETRFPGIAALLPVVGAGLLVRSPSNIYRLTLITRLLSSKALVFVGRLSFSIYLWHWSLIVILQFIFPDILDNTLGRILVFVLTLLLSFISYKLIEVPSARIKLNIPAFYRFKTTPNLRIFVRQKIAPDMKMVLKFSTAIILIFASTQLLKTAPESNSIFLDPEVSLSSSDSIEADFTTSTETSTLSSQPSIDWNRELQKSALVRSYSDATVPAFKDLRTAPWGLTMIDPNCKVFNETAPSQNSADCIKPNPSAKFRVLLLGDSHAYMLSPSILNHYRKAIDFQIIGRSGCPVGGMLKPNSNNSLHIKHCQQLWTDYIPSKLNTLDYDVVIFADDGGTDLLQIKTAIKNVKNLNTKGAQLVFISPSPRYPNPLDCISASRGLENCEGTPNVLGERVFREMNKEISSSLTELSPMLCLGNTCPPVIANTFVTRDGSHFTGQFSELIKDSLKLPRL